MLIDRGDAKICSFDPAFGDDLCVTVNDPLTSTRWHLGQVSRTEAQRSVAVAMTGVSALGRAPSELGYHTASSPGRPLTRSTMSR